MRRAPKRGATAPLAISYPGCAASPRQRGRCCLTSRADSYPRRQASACSAGARAQACRSCRAAPVTATKTTAAGVPVQKEPEPGALRSLVASTQVQTTILAYRAVARRTPLAATPPTEAGQAKAAKKQGLGATCCLAFLALASWPGARGAAPAMRPPREKMRAHKVLTPCAESGCQYRCRRRWMPKPREASSCPTREQATFGDPTWCAFPMRVPRPGHAPAPAPGALDRRNRQPGRYSRGERRKVASEGLCCAARLQC